MASGKSSTRHTSLWENTNNYGQAKLNISFLIPVLERSSGGRTNFNFIFYHEYHYKICESHYFSRHGLTNLITQS